MQGICFKGGLHFWIQMENAMNEAENMNLNPLGYIFHSQPLVIPVKRRNLVHICQSNKISEAYNVTRMH